MRNPLAVTTAKPSFSWAIEAEEADVFQTAYQIRVFDESGKEIWDSGKVESRETIDITYEGAALVSLTSYTYQIRVWNQKGKWADSEAARFETAFMDASEWTAEWIEPDPLPQLETNPLILANKEWDEQVAAMMRGEPVEMRLEGDIMKALPIEPYDPAVCMHRTFAAKKPVTKARLFITSHGIYEAKLNGQAVTDSILNPGFTTYDKRILFQTFDVKELLGTENTMDVTVADGWYKGKIAFGHGCEYGEVPGLLMELHIWYADGSKQIICTDADWTYTYDGPVRLADLFYGETYDASKEDAEKEWKPVIVKGKPDHIVEAQNYPLAKVFERVTAKRVWTSPKGEVLVDFGQNLAGVLEVAIHGEKGETITFEHGEELDPEGNYFYVFEKATQPQKDTYICKGGEEEIFSPKFTYHGFRYVRVTGGKDWTKEQFTALAISTDNPVTGSFSCSDASFNQLQHNIYWSQRSNNITIPTDCPTREKAGWTGDVVVYGSTALYNQQMTAFYKSWLKSIRVEQYENGQILGTVPQIRCYISQAAAGSLGWGDVILTLPWQLYTLNGDKKVLSENYEAMGKWLEAMAAAAYELPNAFNVSGALKVDVSAMSGRQLDNQHYLINSGFHFGDWIIPSVVNEQGFTDGPMSAFLTMNYADTALLAYISDLYANISRILGYTENAEKYEAYAKRIREAFAEEYITEDHRLGQEMQGNYILALKYNMVPEEIKPVFAARLNELIAQNGYKLDTGFMSTPHILDILCDYGYEETAWKVLFQRQCPSWLYEVDHGATTLWENWDAIREDGARSECSFNHYAFGCVGDFLYRRVLGIQNDGLAYDRIRIAPQYDVPLSEVSGSYMSARGKIELTWGKVGEGYYLKGSIPANTAAVVILPNGEQKELTNGKFYLTV